MEMLQIPLLDIQDFCLVFCRVASMLFFLPVFDSRSIPVIFKVGLALGLSVLLFPFLGKMSAGELASPVQFMTGAFTEALLGSGIALMVKLLFAGFQMAGQLVGFQMGLSIANVMDPLTSNQSSVLAELENLFAMLIFLAINAHYWFLRALVESFERIPPLSFSWSRSLVDGILALSAKMFILGIKVAAPVITALLLTSVALGLAARAVPQMNIFIVAFPLKILIGLLVLALTLPHLVGFLTDLFHTFGRELILLLRAL